MDKDGDMFEQNKNYGGSFLKIWGVEATKQVQKDGFEPTHVGKFTRQSHGFDFYIIKTWGLKKKTWVKHGEMSTNQNYGVQLLTVNKKKRLSTTTNNGKLSSVNSV